MSEGLSSLRGARLIYRRSGNRQNYLTQVNIEGVETLQGPKVSSGQTKLL